MASDDFRDLERAIIGNIWTTDEPYRVLRELCDDIGHRFGGSESERLGAEFLRDKMLAYGLENVRIEEFSMAGWERGSAALHLVSPVERDYSCVAMPYCPSADFTAELLDVGEGELADFQRLADQVPGRVVISAAETNKPGERKSHRNDKYGWAVQHGAAGISSSTRIPACCTSPARLLDPTREAAPAGARGADSGRWGLLGSRLDDFAFPFATPAAMVRSI